jgi:SAM-dependent methyltransferase
MSHSDKSGPWNANMYTENLPEEIAFDEDMIKAVVNFYKPLKCLDLGCGPGYYVRYLRDQGVDAWGVEPEDLTELFKSPGHQIQQDISQPFDLKEKYDLVLCLEVVEHVPRDFEDIVFDNVLRHMSKYLVFSGATPGQDGIGHINERHESHWFTHLVRRGLVLLHKESVYIRSSCSLPWYAKNISVWELTRPDVRNLEEIIADKHSQVMTYELSLDNLRKEGEDLQSKLKQTQSGLDQSQLQLQQTQSELEQSQSELQKTQTGLEQSQSQLQQTQTQLEQSQSDLQKTQTGLEQSQSQLQQRQTELVNAQSTISWMESSIFWKLKKIVLRVIRFFGFMRYD